MILRMICIGKIKVNLSRIVYIDLQFPASSRAWHCVLGIVPHSHINGRGVLGLGRCVGVRSTLFGYNIRLPRKNYGRTISKYVCLLNKQFFFPKITCKKGLFYTIYILKNCRFSIQNCIGGVFP